MKNRNIKAILLISSIIIIATIALFFILTRERIFIDWLSFSFVIAAELILAISLLFIERAKNTSGVILRAGVYGIVGLYSIVSISTSILFALVFREAAQFLIALQVVFTAITGIIVTLVYISGAHVAEVNAKTLQSVNRMQELLNKVIVLQSTNKNSPVSPQLNKLYEAFRYSDVSATVATDDIIAAKIAELELLLVSQNEDRTEAGINLIDSILVLVTQRATEMSIVKAGGI